VTTPLLVAGLILAGAIAHAGWNLLVKRSAVSGPTFVWLTVIATSLLLLPVAIVVALLDPPSWPDLAFAVVAAGFLHVAYFLALQAGYRAGDVSVVYPLARGTGPLLSVLLAIPLLGESPTPLGLLGAGAVVIGVVVIGFAGGRATWATARAGVLWGLLVGVVIAAYTLWDARSVTVLAISPILLHAGTNIVEAVLLAPLAARRWSSVRSTLREHGRDVLVVAVLSPLAYILILFALQLAPVAVVAPAREISVVIVGLAGWLLFREPHPLPRLVGAVIVLGGIALLAVAHEI
jgi:drug/metabolite transporter (DMT)-like permease